MDSGYNSAIFGLLGVAIGGLTSFSTTWLTQAAQLRDKHRETERHKREALFNDFVAEATRLYADALSHEKDDITDLVQLYALLAQMRLLTSPPVIKAAEATLHRIIETYLLPNRGLNEMREMAKTGNMNFLIDFGEACRAEIALMPGGRSYAREWRISTGR